MGIGKKMKKDHHKVVITGATRGLGRKIAERLWDEGSNIALVAHNKDALKKLADELMEDARGSQVIEFFVSDLTDLETIPVLIEDIKSSFGDPDILINNAAMQGPIGPLQENDWIEWQKCLNITLLAPALLCRGFVSSMINEHYGKIINISGGGATKARPNFTSYATAKCGLVRFSETLAEEVKDTGVCVNCVAPGAMKSEMTDKIIEAGAGAAGEYEYINALKLLNDNDFTMNRAVDLVLFLASDKSNDINGKLISAVWDPWIELPEHIKDLKQSDVYTLRRIVPEDRGMDWGEV